MAARWGAAEETLTACNMDIFPLETLGEAAGIGSSESLQSCIDPSLLSIFEDLPTSETKGLDEESEASLLTALTEILDNVGDENLSPFDTLPDADLLSKGREHSPLRRMLCLSRSPQKDSLCSTRLMSGGKNLSRMKADSVQRSDGEEEEDSSFTQSPERDESSPDLPGWEGLQLPLPLMLEHEDDDGLSVSLGDLVRHMHPYCMAISVENEEGEQMLPEGGIVLEVVDQGENGEPIFAIPNIEPSFSLDLPPLQQEEREAAAVEEESGDSSEHIVVDDEDDIPFRKNCEIAAAVTQVAHLEAKNEVVRSKKERKMKSPSRRKKKSKENQQPPAPVEGRVLRSGRVRRVAAIPPKNPEKKVVEEKVQKGPKAPAPPRPPPKPEDVKESKKKKENSTAAPLPEKTEKVVPPLLIRRITTPAANETLLTCPATAESSQQLSEAQTPPPASAAGEKTGGSSTPPSASLPPTSSESPKPAAAELPPPISITPPVPEPKPKSLSLEEYRRLRQQKKPAPVEKPYESITKWPSLPEAPKELPPIPHLPDPNPRDPKRVAPQAAKKDEEVEVKPAWQPRGPCAPPTPQALLQPPAYMISSSSKSSAAAPKPQQTQDPSKPPQMSPTAPPDSANASAAPPQTSAKPTDPRVPRSLAPPAPSKPSIQADRMCSSPSSGRQAESVNPKSVQDTRVCPKTTTNIENPGAAAGSVPSVSAVSQKIPGVAVSTSSGPPTSDRKIPKPKEQSTPPCAAPSLGSHNRINHPAVAASKERPAAAQKANGDTQALIQMFTSEMGIEAADMTSLLERFEETQAKEKCVPEVSGRAAAVGNSRAAVVPEKAVMKCAGTNDLPCNAALVSKTTPPNQMWKPLAPLTQLGKSKTSEASKPSPSKVIQIEAQPLPLFRLRSKATPAAAPISPDLACMDHDYCLSNKSVSPGEPSKCWNVKQPSAFPIKPVNQNPSGPTPTPPPVSAASTQSTTNSEILSITQNCPQASVNENMETEAGECSGTETPNASPSQQECVTSPRRRPSARSYRRYVDSPTPSPSCSPKERTRGRSRKRFYRSPSPASSCSDSYSSRSRSRSRSPQRKRYRRRNSDSSRSPSSQSSSHSSPSWSRSPPRRRKYSYSSSRSGSWSRSRSRSLSPQRRVQWSGSMGLHSPSYRPRGLHGTKTNIDETKRRKEKAIEERRVVYVGKIRGSMTQRELRERFSLFGEIEECTLHFREHGDNYGFVTYYNTKDAFTAIENGSKLRKPDELPFDLCFGGRRQFCQSSYADLDSNREYDPLPTKGKYHALDFDTLLKQAQQSLKR
ncbi:peroxisome proliferator-activated receptor gamma coactivator-related protein 1 [Cyprinodon tularosa]|uniref:peroxisome proliferator-activated receptor gamma coactivator-related protein 1 n=1 Tax=Cyprinodon tularosa TaxID=77115 RepID=UPI0018E25EAA|nr:peroxisome proliferator-activated receptor gamma coactivator-related protein 1 [Cyprinodon tularosa]